MKTATQHLYLGSLMLSIALALCSLASPVRAQSLASENTALAVQLFDDAERLFGEAKFAEACPKYAESYRLDPQLGVLIYLAECLEKNGQLASAWGRYREATELAQARGDEREATARDKAATLAPRLSKLLVRVPLGSRLPGLRVTRDDSLVTEAMWGTPVVLDSGTYTLGASAPGHTAWSQEVTVSGEGTVTEVELPKLAEEAPPPTPTTQTTSTPPTITPPSTTREQGPSRFTTPVIVSGVATVLLGAGTAVTGVMYLGKRSDFNKINDESHPKSDKVDARSEAETLGLASTVLGAAAVVGVGLTTYLFVTAGKASDEQPATGPAAAKPSWMVAPWVTASGAGVGVVGRL